MKKLILAASALTALAVAGCNTEPVREPDPVPPAAADTARDVFALLPPAGALTASNVDAGQATVSGKMRANLLADSSSAAIKPFAYFDLDLDSALAATGDTASWDVAFRSTTIRVNGQFQVVSAADFDSVLAAPDSGYATGALPTWYDYSGEPNHTITPKVNQLIILKTSGGKYAKLQIVSYYKGSPASPNGLTDTARYYTFKYFVQKDGSKNLKTAAVAAPVNTFYSLRTGQYADTASQWDIALRTTTVTFNGSYQIVDAADFDSVKAAPAGGYASTGSPAWYDYNDATFTITPKAGKVIVFKTADDKYGKIQFLSYYKGNPASPAGLTDTARYYTFKYFVQADGSTNLANAGNATPYTYYSLRAKATVADSMAQWDLAFRSTTIRVNGASQLVTSNFDTLKTAPEAGYAAGNVSTWYDYSGEPNHTITPQLGKVILIKTADAKYAKIQILSYYQGAPSLPNGLVNTARYYTFRFVLQRDGSRNLQ